MTAPAPRPLTVPEQRALEALADGPLDAMPSVLSRLRMPYAILAGLESRRMARRVDGTVWTITDRGRAYLRTLGVTE